MPLCFKSPSNVNATRPASAGLFLCRSEQQLCAPWTTAKLRHSPKQSYAELRPTITGNR